MQWDQVKSKYSTYVFDCDGVIIDSNDIKSNAFGETVSEYGKQISQQFVNYHQANGGITRQVKFEYFCKNILKLTDWRGTYEKLLKSYSDIVQEQLAEVTFIPGVLNILEELSTMGKSVFVVTGGNELETRSLFRARGINNFFVDILGNPTSKHENMALLKSRGWFEKPSLYFGDSRLDRSLAEEFNLDFLFIYGVTEWKDFPSDMLVAKDFSSCIEIPI